MEIKETKRLPKNPVIVGYDANDQAIVQEKAAKYSRPSQIVIPKDKTKKGFQRGDELTHRERGACEFLELDSADPSGATAWVRFDDDEECMVSTSLLEPLATHSPLPWREIAENGSMGGIEGADGWPVAQCQQPGPDDKLHVRRKANAKLIVDAVNNYDALVAALKEDAGQVLHCSCGAAVTEAEYREHQQRGHDAGEGEGVLSKQTTPCYSANAIAKDSSSDAYAALLSAVMFAKQFLNNLESDTDPDDPLFAIRKRFHAPLHARLDSALALALASEPVGGAGSGNNNLTNNSQASSPLSTAGIRAGSEAESVIAERERCARIVAGGFPQEVSMYTEPVLDAIRNDASTPAESGEGGEDWKKAEGVISDEQETNSALAERDYSVKCKTPLYPIVIRRGYHFWWCDSHHQPLYECEIGKLASSFPSPDLSRLEDDQ